MLGPFSLAAFTAALNANSLMFDSGLSFAANTLQQASVKIVNRQFQSEVLNGQKLALLSNLRRIATLPHEGTPVSRSTLLRAEAMILAIPTTNSIPDITFEDDGMITLDWFVSREKMFSMSIGSTGRIPYAFHSGDYSGADVTYFNDISAPEAIVQALIELPA